MKLSDVKPCARCKEARLIAAALLHKADELDGRGMVGRDTQAIVAAAAEDGS